MRRLLVLAGALLALLAAAPAAGAATFTVNDAGDEADVTPGDGQCDAQPGAGSQCTLRAAIMEANALAGADAIDFDAAIGTITPAAALPAVEGPTAVDGGGDVTLVTPPGATEPLLHFAAAASTLRAITLAGAAGGAAAQMVSAAGDGFRLDDVVIRDAPDVGVQLSGPGAVVDGVEVLDSSGAGVVVLGASARLDGVQVHSAGGTGIALWGPGTTVSNARVSGSAGHGILMAGDRQTVYAGVVHSNRDAGAHVSAQDGVISQTIFHGNGDEPIQLAPGANGGIATPAGLRIGPRRADGSLPLTGTTTGGTLEIFTGNPFSAFAPAYFGLLSVAPGEFTYQFQPEPAPGTTFAFTLTSGGTSEFALATVPADIVSPALFRARAVSESEVRVVPSEPVDPATVNVADFKLSMAGSDRTVSAASVASDGSIALASGGWKPGEAGFVELTAAGALADPAGNVSLAPTRIRVAAGPGDFVAPLATRMRLRPRSICLSRAARCRRPGAVLAFQASEEGKVEVVVQRGSKRVGTRTFTVKPGLNRIRFDGRLRGRKLRAGPYRLLLFMTDVVGNRNLNPPITLFSIRRVTR